MTPSTPVGAGSAHAKFILIGEHAVVHGRPAIGVPLPALIASAEARTAAGELSVESDLYTGALATAPAALAPVAAAIRTALAHFGREPRDVALRLGSAIPIGRGLGSSAAVAQAVAEAVRALAGAPLDEADRFAIVQAAERVAHGTPSGLDARATRSSRPILFLNGEATAIDADFGGVFVVADTGVQGSTSAAVGDVAAFLRAHPDRGAELLDRLDDLTRAAAVDLENDRRTALGERMTEAHRTLTELGAGHPALDALVGAALEAGALGAKLTGGGQGGCVVALAGSEEDAPRIVAALAAAGAVDTWLVSLDAVRA